MTSLKGVHLKAELEGEMLKWYISLHTVELKNDSKPSEI